MLVAIFKFHLFEADDPRVVGDAVVLQLDEEVLAPEDRVFSFPNKITAKDFDGWVQERSLYCMSKWDEHFKPLLSSHDPDEAPQKGCLLEAPVGKGLYIYSSYAFFRQLPAGVPGAIRLFANLLSLPRNPAFKQAPPPISAVRGTPGQ